MYQGINNNTYWYIHMLKGETTQEIDIHTIADTCLAAVRMVDSLRGWLDKRANNAIVPLSKQLQCKKLHFSVRGQIKCRQKPHIYLQALKDLVLKGRNFGGKLYVALVKPLLNDAVRLEGATAGLHAKVWLFSKHTSDSCHT